MEEKIVSSNIGDQAQISKLRMDILNIAHSIQHDDGYVSEKAVNDLLRVVDQIDSDFIQIPHLVKEGNLE